MTTCDLPEILSLEETCTLLRVSRETLVKEIKRGNIKSVKIGRQYRICKKDIEIFLEGK